jgi:hypothetical protein
MKPVQFNLLLTKVRSNLDNTSFEKEYGSNNRIKKAISTFRNGIVEIQCESNCFAVNIVPQGSSVRLTQGKLKFPLNIKYFSIYWWKWRSLCKDLEKEYRRQERIDYENAVKWEIEKIDRAIIETFPDVIEEQIFGDDND